jgi:prepilin-type N-terminal cleavage/methylation domain-containing protein
MRPVRARILAAMSNRRGFTLLELCLVLLIAGILSAMAVPHFGRARDRIAVRAAATELAGALAVTRAAAIRSGGASLHIDPSAGTAWIQTAAGLRLSDNYPIAERYGVRMETARTGTTVLRYDALGIGRITNAVISCHRGSEVASVTVSSYGRVRL